MIAKRARVVGRVQGVWFRARTKEQADALGARGWVRNLPDDSVEAHVEGDEAAVAALLAWMRRGPALARVDRLEEQEAAPEGFRSFDIRW
jgi:acylphosphatase